MKTRKSIQKRERILAAAAEVIAERGYAESTLAEIGERAGTFAGSLYYYFPSKEALVEALLNVGTTTISEPVRARLEALPADAGAADRIRAALDEHVERMLAKDPFVAAYWKLNDQVPEDIRERHREHPRSYGKLWRALMREGQAEGVIRKDVDPNLAQLFLLGATIYALEWYNPSGGLTPLEISDRLADMFFRGIGAEAAETPRPVAARERVIRVVPPLPQAKIA